jgi:hypothetical protein
MGTRADAIGLWRAVIATLESRRLLPRGATAYELPHARALVYPDKVRFVLDMERLPVPQEEFLRRGFLEQLRATAGGRRVVITNGYGLAITFGLEPQAPAHDVPALPARLTLERAAIPRGPYAFALAHTPSGPITLSLAEMDGMLVAGTRRYGKTTLLLSILGQLLLKHGPDELRVGVLTAPLKEGDFRPLAGLPHLLAPPAIDVLGARRVFQALQQGMRARQLAFERCGVSNLDEYRALGLREPAPALLLVVDELAELAATPGGAQLMDELAGLVRVGGAFGIYAIVATQRPDRSVISAQLKANLATRVAFYLPDAANSRVVLDRAGAEKLPRDVKGRLLTNAAGAWQTGQAYCLAADVWEQVARSSRAPVSATG